MNSPAHPIASPDRAEDLYGWAQAQAALLRSVRPATLDWAALAEELEASGQSQYDALESALRVLILHILKWEAQPGFRSRSWLLSIREQHRQFERCLARNPGLKSALEELRDEAHRQALVIAQAETGLPASAFPVEPLGWNVILNPPGRDEDLPGR